MILTHPGSRYGRDGIVNRQARFCNGCGEHRDCVCSDSSEGEYGPVCLCLACVQRCLGEPEFIEEPEAPMSPGHRPATIHALDAVLKQAYSEASETRISKLLDWQRLK